MIFQIRAVQWKFRIGFFFFIWILTYLRSKFMEAGVVTEVLSDERPPHSQVITFANLEDASVIFTSDFIDNLGYFLIHYTVCEFEELLGQLCL